MKLKLATLALSLLAGPAFAINDEMCKDVKIIVENNRDEDIRVLDIEYWDPTAVKWRKENAVGKLDIGKNGKKKHYIRNLEEVRNNEINVKVRYKISKLGKWKNPKWSFPSRLTAGPCTEGKEYFVHASEKDLSG